MLFQVFPPRLEEQDVAHVHYHVISSGDRLGIRAPFLGETSALVEIILACRRAVEETGGVILLHQLEIQGIRQTLPGQAFITCQLREHPHRSVVRVLHRVLYRAVDSAPVVLRTYRDPLVFTVPPHGGAVVDKIPVHIVQPPGQRHACLFKFHAIRKAVYVFHGMPEYLMPVRLHHSISERERDRVSGFEI